MGRRKAAKGADLTSNPNARADDHFSHPYKFFQKRLSKRLTSLRLLLSNEATRLAAVLFQELHIGDRHAPVHGFAHVVDGEQGDLYAI